MCLICIHFDKLTIDESIRNLGEIKETVEEKHYIEVVSKIMTRIVKEYDLDPKYVPTMVSDYISDHDF